jgi:hypothetical protein
VGGSIGAVLLAAAIFLAFKHKRGPRKPVASSSGDGNYGQLSVIPSGASNYDVGNVTLPPESTANYDVVPGAPSNHKTYAVGNLD